MTKCEWCRGPINATRRDAVFCSQRCRQAAHRFKRDAVARARASQPMRFAYADPPYPGNAHLYRDHPDFAGEVDHGRLVEQLATDYPDGWALSTDARSLAFVLSLVAGVDGVRVAAWFRRLRPHATARWPISSWEPVVYAGGRPSLPGRSDASGLTVDTSSIPGADASRLQTCDASAAARYDALVCRSGPRTTDPARVVGAKPAEFAYWIFDLLGARPGDELVDLFPGSGGIARAWAHYSSLDVEHDASPRRDETRRVSTPATAGGVR